MIRGNPLYFYRLYAVYLVRSALTAHTSCCLFGECEFEPMMIDVCYLSSPPYLIHIVHHSCYPMYSAKHLLRCLNRDCNKRSCCKDEEFCLQQPLADIENSRENAGCSIISQSFEIHDVILFPQPAYFDCLPASNFVDCRHGYGAAASST